MQLLVTVFVVQTLNLYVTHKYIITSLRIHKRYIVDFIYKT